MARLAAGTRKRADGTLEKRFSIDGKRYSVYGKNAAEIAEKEQEMREQIKAGMYTKNAMLTIGEYFGYWIDEKGKTAKQNTLRVYESMYTKHIEPSMKERRIRDIERREIVELQNRLIDKGVSVYSVNYTMMVLKAMLSDAVRDDIIKVNPAANIRSIKEDREKASKTIHRALTEKEQKAFMSEAASEYYYELYAFLLCTGMRIGEATALTWADIDYINKEIHITKTVSYDKEGKQIITTPKSKSAVRDIPLTDTARDVLKKQKSKMALLNGSNIIPMNNRIFNAENGSMVRNRTVNATIEHVLDRLEKKGNKIEPIAAHCFRDTFATRFIEQGGQPQTLKAILGHSTLAMTMDLYAHVLPNTKQKEMNSIQIAL